MQANQNQGAALITALVLLVALTLVALSGMQSTTVQLQISGNDEATVEAYQYAQSVVDAVTEQASSFPVGAADGYTICSGSGTGCNRTDLSLSQSMFTGGVGVFARVELLKVSTAPRMGSNASSANLFSGAYFKVSGQYDETTNKRGKADVVQGMVLIIPNP